jgi:hypothetical protein
LSLKIKWGKLLRMENKMMILNQFNFLRFKHQLIEINKLNPLKWLLIILEIVNLQDLKLNKTIDLAFNIHQYIR